MGCERVGPDGGGPIFETVTPADNGAKIGGFPLCFAELRRFMECRGDDRTARRSETVVGELESLEGSIVGEEGHHGIDRATTESIITEIDLDQGGLVNERVANRGQRERDFGDQASSEYVCKVCDLKNVST